MKNVIKSSSLIGTETEINGTLHTRNCRRGCSSIYSKRKESSHFYVHLLKLHTAITSKYDGLFTSLFKSLYEGDLPKVGKSLFDGVLS